MCVGLSSVGRQVYRARADARRNHPPARACVCEHTVICCGVCYQNPLCVCVCEWLCACACVSRAQYALMGGGLSVGRQVYRARADARCEPPQCMCVCEQTVICCGVCYQNPLCACVCVCVCVCVSRAQYATCVGLSAGWQVHGSRADARCYLTTHPHDQSRHDVQSTSSLLFVSYHLVTPQNKTE